MKLNSIAAIALLFCCVHAHGQTSVGGTLTQNTQWTLAGSPYSLTSTVGVLSGVTLTIDAGVQINGNFDLLVKGVIKINGTNAQPVIFQNTRLLLKSTDLSMSTVQYTQFNQSGVQLADESEFNQDNPKNSNTLTVSNCSFSNGSYARTKGYQTSAKLHLENCSWVNSTVYGYYPRSEKIEINNSNITNSTITSDSYNYGIVITNSVATSTTFSLGCCGSNFDISDSQINSSGFTTFNSYGSVKISNVTMSQTYINIPGASLTMSESTMSATSIPQPFLIYSDYCNISKSTLAGYSGIGLVKVNNLYGNNLFSKVNFQSFNVGIEIVNLAVIKIDSCNFINGTTYNLNNQSNKYVDAQYNYWGTTDESVIQNKLYDLYDNINSGLVDYSHFSTSPIVTNPLPVPSGIYKGRQTSGTLITWNNVNNLNVIGYKVYKKTGPASFQFLVDAGNSNSLITTESFQSDFVVTAYDASADGINDLFEGHESNYSTTAIEFFKLTSADQIEACQKSTITTEFAKYFNFNNSAHFDLYISANQADFSHAVLLTSILSSDPSKIGWAIPDSVAAERTLYARVQSREFNVVSQAIAIKVNAKPIIDFNSSVQACPLGSYQLKFTGVTNSNLTLSWNLDGGTLLSNDSNTKLSVIWPAGGNRNVTLQGTQNGCSSSVVKVLNAVTPPVLSAPAISSIAQDETSRKNIVAWVSDSALTKKISIYRKSASGQFDLIGSTDYSNKSYVDQTSAPDQQSARYKISATDACGRETNLSAEIHTVFLQISPSGFNNWNLSWENRDENSQVLIYRRDNSSDWKKIGTVSSTSTAFTDLITVPVTACYQLTMAAGATQLKSNIVCNGVTAVEGNFESIRTYPNPTSDLINFHAAEKGTYDLVDMMDKHFMTGLAEVGNNELSLLNIPAGVYLLKVMTENTVKSVRIVKN